jgi:hypothetical protein
LEGFPNGRKPRGNLNVLMLLYSLTI